jgi:uncharacterized protein (DUF488 family)
VTIYTIGHSNLPLEKFLSLLSDNGITELADIRSVPFSRFYPWFNRETLALSLKNRGIDYRFEGTRLGGRITDPACFVSGRLPDRKIHIAELVDFDVLQTRPWFREGIQNLIDWSGSGSLAVLCSEEDPARCHRNLLVGRALTGLGVQVIHLRSKTDGGPAQGELF